MAGFRAILSLLLAGMVMSAPACGASDDELPPHRDGAVLLKFRSNIPPLVQDAALLNAGANEIGRTASGTLILHVGNGRVSAVLNLLKARADVLFAEPDYASQPIGAVQGASSPLASAAALAAPASSVLPNDTNVGLQWAVQNTGQNANGVSGTPGADESSLLAWRVGTGTNAVVIGILDGGVQYSHPDLFTNMWNNPGGIGGCAAGTHGYNILTSTCDPMDDDTSYGGHGTHVSGILGATGNNAAGVAGVNWTTTIMGVKWVASNDTAFTSDLIKAIDWVIAAKQAGVNVRVVNDSATWPGTSASQALSDEIDLLGTNDILFVTAAGNTAQNNDTTPRYPCSYNRPNMICVAASDQMDNLWSSSNYGLNTVQLAAPGVNIYSTKRISNYGYISGTSMASPQVAGTAALLLSFGYMSVSALRSAILASVDVLPSLNGFVATSGRLNVCKAVPGCSAAAAVPANVVSPAVTGLAQYGALVGASTGVWSGLPSTYSYQWYRCDPTGANCSPITGATSQTYAVLASADVGNTLTVAVTGSNSSGAATVQSGASAPVTSAVSPFNVASTVTDGQALGTTFPWQATPAQAVNFVQFYVDGVLSQTDTSSPYIYNQGTTGVFDTSTLSNGTHVLGLRALSTDNRTYAFYGATVTVGNVPQNLTLPAISGSAQLGQMLSTSNGTWTNSPSTFTYQWNRCNTSGSGCVPIAGATNNTYTIVVADGNTTLRSTVTATNTVGSGSATSAPTSIVTGVVVISTASLPNGVQNIAYSATLAATGGATPYTWSISSGTLPAGLTLASNTGVISGTPSGTGTSIFTVQVTDGNSQTATEALSITINPAVSISTTSLPAGTQNSAYSATLAATGGATPYTWSISSGTLPTGLTLASNTGVISGTPSGTGTSNFTVQVTDGNSQTAVKALSIIINPAASGAITLAQTAAVEGPSVGSLSVAFPAANTAHNLIIAFVRMSTATQTVSVTDSAGNVYTDAVSQVQSADGHQIHLFYSKNIQGLPNTVTATFSSTNNHPWLAIYEYAGLSTTNPLDQKAAAQGSSSTASTGPTATTSSANELVFAGIGMVNNFSGTVTAGSGYTLGQQDTAKSRAANETLLTSATGSYTGTCTFSRTTSWSAIVATFQP